VPPDINRLRFDGFQAVMKRDFSMTDFEVRLVRSESCQHGIESELMQAMASSGGDLDAIYLIPPFNAQLVRVLEARQTAAKMAVVVHDMDPFTDHYFQNKLVTGVIYQNPILQGYYAVKILENLLESGRPPPQDQITIVHSLVLSENRDLFRNHYLFTRMMSDTVE
jgi:LacI family transcriptional regulator